MKPDQQPHPHKSFQDEILYINEIIASKCALINWLFTTKAERM